MSPGAGWLSKKLAPDHRPKAPPDHCVNLVAALFMTAIIRGGRRSYFLASVAASDNDPNPFATGDACTQKKAASDNTAMAEDVAEQELEANRCNKRNTSSSSCRPPTARAPARRTRNESAATNVEMAWQGRRLRPNAELPSIRNSTESLGAPIFCPD